MTLLRTEDGLDLPQMKRTKRAQAMLGPFALNRIHKMDCIKAMRRLPDQCADIAIVDPPYNASKGGDWKWDNSVKLPGFGGDWEKIMSDWDDMPLHEYLAFSLQWANEVKRLVRPTGSLWIHGTYHNIGIINFVLQLLRIEIINEVIWYKRNSFPNLSGRRLTASHETLLWAHTGSKRREYYFDYSKAKSLSFDGDLLKEAGKQMRTVWDIPNNKRPEELAAGKHPAQKPLRLLERMLMISGKPGDVLLVPFAGSGADCVAASLLGINFIGFELNNEYLAIARKRLASQATYGGKIE